MPFLSFFPNRMILRARAMALPAAILAASLGACFTACTGPRQLKFGDETYRRRPSTYPIDIFVGEVDIPHRKIAIIESKSYDIDNAITREEQLEELKRAARARGADAVQELRILAKKAKGFTVDERSPMPAWKQGEYPLFFMRGTAIIYESSLRSPLLLPTQDGENDGDDDEGEVSLDPRDIPVQGAAETQAPQ